MTGPNQHNGSIQACTAFLKAHASDQADKSPGFYTPMSIAPGELVNEPHIQDSGAIPAHSIKSGAVDDIRQQLEAILGIDGSTLMKAMDSSTKINMVEQLLAFISQTVSSQSDRAVADELESIVGWRSDAREAVLIKPEFRHLPLADNVDSRHQMLVSERLRLLGRETSE